MENLNWIPLTVGVLGLVLAFHQYMANRGSVQAKDLEKQIEEKAEMCVNEAVKPLERELQDIKTKLNNGVLRASREHTEAIGDLRVDIGKIDTTMNHMANDVSNLSRQLETVLLGKGTV